MLLSNCCCGCSRQFWRRRGSGATQATGATTITAMATPNSTSTTTQRQRLAARRHAQVYDTDLPRPGGRSEPKETNLNGARVNCEGLARVVVLLNSRDIVASIEHELELVSSSEGGSTTDGSTDSLCFLKVERGIHRFVELMTLELELELQQDLCSNTDQQSSSHSLAGQHGNMSLPRNVTTTRVVHCTGTAQTSCTGTS